MQASLGKSLGEDVKERGEGEQCKLVRVGHLGRMREGEGGWYFQAGKDSPLGERVMQAGQGRHLGKTIEGEEAMEVH